MSIRRIALLATALVAVFAMSIGLAGAQTVPAQGEWTGEINAADASQLVVSGVRFAATDVQVQTGLELTPGTVVQVKFTAEEGSLNAVWVERLEAGDDDLPGTGEITGPIDSATTDTVSIGGVTFNVVGAMIDDDASLIEGSLVELHFTFDGTTLVVNRVEAENDEDDAKAIGVIEAMDVTTITVGGVVFDITTAQIDNDGVLAVGVVVEIEFTVAADGRVIALEIDFADDDLFDDNDLDDDGDDDLDFTGTIEAMSGSTITVNGMVFDISQAVIDDNGVLAVGLVVDIDYVVATDGRNVALEIDIEDDSDDDIDDDHITVDFVLSGTITAIEGTSLTISGVTVDISGADIDVDGTLKVGDAVTIYFQRDASGALTAIEVDEIDDIDDPFDDDDDDDRDDDDDDDFDDFDDDDDFDDFDDDDDDIVTVIDGCVRPDGWQIYRVRRGDTLSEIAAAANTTVDALVSANCLTDSAITAGQALFVPTRIGGSDYDDDDDDDMYDDDDDDDRDDDHDDDDDRDDDDDDDDRGRGRDDDDDDDDDDRDDD